MGLFGGISKQGRLWVTDGESAHVIHLTAWRNRRVRTARASHIGPYSAADDGDNSSDDGS